MIVIKTLRWDDWNRAHVARHQVTEEEVEQVRLGNYVYWATYNSRVMIVGETSKGRLLSIVLGHKGEGVFYPVTARDASRKDRRRYLELKGGEQAA